MIINLNLLEGPHLVASLHTGGHPGEGEGAEVVASCFDRNLEDWIMNKTELTLTLPTFVQSLAQQVCLYCLGEGFLEEKNRISHKSVFTDYSILLSPSPPPERCSAACSRFYTGSWWLPETDTEITIFYWSTVDR